MISICVNSYLIPEDFHNQLLKKKKHCKPHFHAGMRFFETSNSLTSCLGSTLSLKIKQEQYKTIFKGN